VPLTFDEFKITKQSLVEKDNFLNDFLKQLTPYARQRCRFMVVQGLKYWRIIKQQSNVH